MSLRRAVDAREQRRDRRWFYELLRAERDLLLDALVPAPGGTASDVLAQRRRAVREGRHAEEDGLGAPYRAAVREIVR